MIISLIQKDQIPAESIGTQLNSSRIFDFSQ